MKFFNRFVVIILIVVGFTILFYVWRPRRPPPADELLQATEGHGRLKNEVEITPPLLKPIREQKLHDVRDVVPEKFKEPEKSEVTGKAKIRDGTVSNAKEEYDPYIEDSKILNIKNSNEPGQKAFSGKPGMPFLPFRFISSDCDFTGVKMPIAMAIGQDGKVSQAEAIFKNSDPVPSFIWACNFTLPEMGPVSTIYFPKKDQ